MHTKMHSLCCKCFRKKIKYLYTKFFKRHLRNKIITVDSSINDVYAFSPIYFSTSFPHFQFFTWIMDVPGVLKQDTVDWFPFSTASILIQNRVKIFMELYFTVSRNIFQCILVIKLHWASRKTYENINFVIPAQAA